MSGRIAGLVLSGLALAVAFASTARADVPTLRVTNLGQSSAPVEVGQPPFDVTATAGCAYPFTLANESGCPAGTWPPLGQRWGSIEDVAGGDTLRLEFSSPVTGVEVGSTSNYTPGLHDPDGKAIPNYDVVPESTAVSTSDPAVWLTTLPQLDYRAISGSGYTFSVAAQDAAGYHDYPLGIRSPRYANELTFCSIAYYSTGRQQYLCLDKATPPGVPRMMVKLSGASYDGHVLSLTAQVSEVGTLRIGVPTTCGDRNRAACHRKTWVARHATHRGRLVIRKSVSLRLGPGRRMTVPVRFGMAPERMSISTLKVNVHLTGG